MAEDQSISGISVGLGLDISAFSSGVAKAREQLEGLTKGAAGATIAVPLHSAIQKAGASAPPIALSTQLGTSRSAVHALRVDVNQHLRTMAQTGQAVQVPIALGRAPYGAMRSQIARGIGEVPVRIRLDPVGVAGIKSVLTAVLTQTSAGSRSPAALAAASDIRLPRRAMGGPVAAHQSYLVGERGPERFTPDRGGEIRTLEQYRRDSERAYRLRMQIRSQERAWGSAGTVGNDAATSYMRGGHIRHASTGVRVADRMSKTELDFEGNLRRAASRLQPHHIQGGLSWYTDAGKHGRAQADRYGIGHEKALGILAALSAGTAWTSNQTKYEKILKANAAGKPFPYGMRFDAHRKAYGIMTGSMTPTQAFATSPKVGQFYGGLSGDLSTLTIDRWATRTTTGGALHQPPKSMRPVMEAAWKRIAAEKGMQNAQFQAALWLLGKEESGQAPGQFSMGLALGGRVPNPDLIAAAAAYSRSRGMQPPDVGRYAPLDEDFSRRTAKAYEAMPIGPDRLSRRAYHAFASETEDQYEFLRRAGFHFTPSRSDPYQPLPGGPTKMQLAAADVRQNKNLTAFASSLEHPLLTNMQNWKFRGVHDLMGHLAEGNSIGPRGEYNAAIKHSQMFSSLAQMAMLAETHGQNSVVNFSDTVLPSYSGLSIAEVNKARPGSIYAEQKAQILPRDILDEFYRKNGRMSRGGPTPGQSSMFFQPEQPVRLKDCSICGTTYRDSAVHLSTDQHRRNMRSPVTRSRSTVRRSAYTHSYRASRMDPDDQFADMSEADFAAYTAEQAPHRWKGGVTVVQRTLPEGYKLHFSRDQPEYEGKFGKFEHELVDPVRLGRHKSIRGGLTHDIADFTTSITDASGKVVAVAPWQYERDWRGEDSLHPIMTKVLDRHQGKGLASAMYRASELFSGKSIKPSHIQLTGGKGLWAQLNRPFGKRYGDIPLSGYASSYTGNREDDKPRIDKLIETRKKAGLDPGGLMGLTMAMGDQDDESPSIRRRLHSTPIADRIAARNKPSPFTTTGDWSRPSERDRLRGGVMGQTASSMPSWAPELGNQFGMRARRFSQSTARANDFYRQVNATGEIEQLPLGLKAAGGDTPKGLYIVNEIGKEKFVPKSLEGIIPPDVAAQIPGGHAIHSGRPGRGRVVDINGPEQLWQAPGEGWIIPNKLIGRIPHAMAGRKANSPGGAEKITPDSGPHAGETWNVNRTPLYAGEVREPNIRDAARKTISSPPDLPASSGASTYVDPVRAAEEAEQERLKNLRAPRASQSSLEELDRLRDEEHRQSGVSATRGMNILRLQRQTEENKLRVSRVSQRGLTIKGAFSGIGLFLTGAGQRMAHQQEYEQLSRQYENQPGVPKGVDPVEYFGRQQANALIERRTAFNAAAETYGPGPHLAAEYERDQAGKLIKQRDASGRLRPVQTAANIAAGGTREGFMTPEEAGQAQKALASMTTEERHAAEAQKGSTQQMSIAKKALVGWTTQADESSKLVKKNESLQARADVALGKSRTGMLDQVKGIAVGMIGYQLLGEGMAVAAKGATEVLSPLIDQMTGFHAVTDKTTSALGQQLTAQHGNIDATFGQTAATTGLSKSSSAFIQSVLQPAAIGKAGAVVGTQTSDLFRATLGTQPGAAPAGLYGGYGGIGGGGFGAQLLGGGAGFAQVMGDTLDLMNKTIVAGQQPKVEASLWPLTYHQAPGGLPPTQDQISSGIRTIEMKPRQIAPPTQDQISSGLQASTAQLEYIDTFNEAAKRGAVQLGGLATSADQFVKIDPAGKMASDIRDSNLPDELKKIAVSGYALVDSNGNLLTKIKDTNTGLQQILEGLQVEDKSAYVAQQKRALAAQYASGIARTQLATGGGGPGGGPISAANGGVSGLTGMGLGLQLAASPLMKATTGLAAGFKPALTNLKQEQVLQDQVTAQGKQGIIDAKAFINTNAGSAQKDAFTSYVDTITSKGTEILGIQTKLADQSAAVSLQQYANSQRILKRSIRDAQGLVSGHGATSGPNTNLGAVERLQFTLQQASEQLSIAMSQRQINFSVAAAGFQAPGLSGEERAARQAQAKYEASIAQKQLNIQKQQVPLARTAFDVGAVRSLADLQAQRAINVAEFQLSQEQIAAQKAINARTIIMSIAQQNAQKVLDNAVSNWDIALGSAANYTAQFGGDVNNILVDLRRGIDQYFGITPTNPGTGGYGPKGANGNHGASGLLFNTRGETSLTVGEAGSEHVAVLRNPKPGMLGALAGGGPSHTSFSFQISGNNIRSDSDIDALVRRITDEVERKLNSRGAMLGLRSLGG